MVVKMAGVILSMMVLGCSTMSKETMELQEFGKKVGDGSIQDCDSAKILGARETQKICDEQDSYNCDLARGADNTIREHCLDRMAQKHFSRQR